MPAHGADAAPGEHYSRVCLCRSRRRKSDLSSTVVTGQKISRKSDLLSSRRGLARNGAPHQRVLGIVNSINRTIGDDAGLYVARRQI